MFSLFVGRIIRRRLEEFFGFRLIILGVGACEAAVGLGMLISFVRVKGRDLVGVGLRIKL